MAKGFKITLAGESSVFWAEPGLTVLRASLRGGGGLLSSCRNGTCRACQCRLLEGEIAYVIDWPGLSAEEKAEGWFLPCVAQARSDLVLLRPTEA
ncbi:2Fe-2S iron-sulfur cluster-binding protein [Roseateles albus]|uniref:2Fe-2S iron-sulfur cluster-binding protein n=1 Tax=Roseateles albus TaxID=2987525 RepID=A0ABT5KJX7_9BURK|nr:2Fe-2S iron-sulfur cluster-binding protein [Roseateles albus]MDC8773744.1 2Fe-2S iron-sulfur cluster-binding protein [Roseateles albus]